MTSTRRDDARRCPLSAAFVALAGLLLSALAACTSSPAPPAAGFSGPPYTLRVLASSELADMAPILRQAASATGVTVDLTLTGSLAGAQQVIDGTAERKYDAVWFASDNYLNLYPDGLSRLNGTTEIISSPVVLGLRSSVAHRLGWDHSPVTWVDVAQAATRHEFTFGMTDPATSNSGLSALVAHCSPPRYQTQNPSSRACSTRRCSPPRPPARSPGRTCTTWKTAQERCPTA
jgi:Ca-activated chloride channel family protein